MQGRKAGSKQISKGKYVFVFWLFFFGREDFVKLPKLTFLIWAEAKTKKQAEDRDMEKLIRSGLHKSKLNQVKAMRVRFQYCIQLLAVQIWWLLWRRRKRIQFLGLEFVLFEVWIPWITSKNSILMFQIYWKCYPIGFTFFDSSNIFLS